MGNPTVTAEAVSQPSAEFAVSDLLMRNVELYGPRRAVVHGDITMTWSQLASNVAALAARMAADGVQRGDRIAILQPNGVELVEVAYATAMLGAVVVPVSPRLTEHEVAYVVKDAEITLAFVAEGHPTRNAFSATPVVATRCTDYVVYRESGVGLDAPERGTADDVVMQLYTSGTTGRPKGALLTQRAMIQNGLTIQVSQQLTCDDVFLSATPLTHAAAGTRIFSLGIDGMALVILDRFTPEAFVDAVARHGVTTTILVPAMLRDLVESSALAGADLSTLRFIVYGAAPTPEPLIRRSLDTLPCGLVQGYGLTEGSPALTVFTADEHVRFAADPALGHRLASIGRVVPAARIAVLDGSGNPVPRGEAGEIAVRSTKSMAGYWHNPEATGATFRNGWLLTGDIGRQDDHGYLYLVDRKKDMLISGGINVYPSEIEAVLIGHDDVREASVVGVHDERWGESPVAFVVARETRTGDSEALVEELRVMCRDRLAGYKQPKQINVVADMPRNETGKILKGVLRDLVQGGGS